MLNQAPGSIFMVRPSHFGYNPLTASSNVFQKSDSKVSQGEINRQAREEFDHFTDLLIKSNIGVLIFEDLTDTILPDSVFPNNWISLHHDGTVVLYPMMAENRRLERRKDILLQLQNRYHYNIDKIIDYSSYEIDGQFLEGTGSVVFDYMHKIAYANASPRTNKKLFHKLCDDLGFKELLFNAQGPAGKDIYHTNVMMSLGTRFVIVCLEAVVDMAGRSALMQSFEKTNHEVVEISYQQMIKFAGNMIELHTKNGTPVLAMSESAYRSLSKAQLNQLSRYADIIFAPIPVIEKYGGGSARCMIAANFLPRI